MLQGEEKQEAMMIKLRRKKSGVKTNVDRSSSNGLCDDWRSRGERKRSMNRGMMRKRSARPMIRTSAAEWHLTWEQVAHTSRPRRIMERKKRRRKRHKC